MFRRLLARRRSRQDTHPRGQILLLFGAGLVVFVGLAALTVDVGTLYLARRSYQNATDAAALAGASYLTRPLGEPCATVGVGTPKRECARRASWNYLNDQLGLGLSDVNIVSYAGSNTGAAGQSVVPPGGGDAYTIWVSTPPSGAGPAASMSTVTTSNQVMFVRVDRHRDVFFGRIFVPNGFHVNAWSTAGLFPDRWAVITLRRGRGGTQLDSGPSNTTDIKLAGTNSTLNVVDGDVGGNWGMVLNSSSTLKVSSTTGDDADIYLVDYVSCGASCWGVSQLQDGAGNPKAAKELPGFVPDPNYAAPTIPGATWPNGPVDNAAPALDIPNGDTSGSAFGTPPSVTINSGSLDATTGKCEGPSGTTADAPRLGPGTYRDITVTNNHCVVLDPVNRHSAPGSLTDIALPIPSTQLPGIYYVTGILDVRNSALVVGDGATVIIRPKSTGGAQFSPQSGGVMNLNTGFQTGTAQKLGGWTTKGASPYTWNGVRWVYQSSQEASAPQYGVGIALYVLKPGQAGITDNDGTDVIAVNSGAGLSWRGVTYAPMDNVQISGQPRHDGIGQLISWTFTFNGGTNVTQSYDGVGGGYPYLIEPCVQVSGACQ